MNKKVITIVSVARSGTSYFCTFLREAFANINVNGELFGKERCSVDNLILKKLGNCYCDINETDNFDTIKKKIRKQIDVDNPLDLIEKIKGIVNKDIIVFKVLASQLKYQKIRELITASDFVIFLVRNKVDMFISTQKAQTVGKYRGVDTTEIKIDFCINSYIMLRKKIITYFDKMISFAKDTNKQYIVIAYEDFHKLTDHQKQDYLYDNVLKLCSDSVAKTQFETELHTLKKQDQSVSYKDKINNYDEFAQFFNTIEYKDDLIGI